MAGLPAQRDADFTAQVRLTGLQARHRVRVSGQVRACRSHGLSRQWGASRLHPSLQRGLPVSFVFSGDLGGGGYCREIVGGYQIFAAMEPLVPDFFIATGDMIYADNACTPYRPDRGNNLAARFQTVNDPSVDWTMSDELRPVFSAHWRYNRADPNLQRFLARVPMYAQRDDHEALNDSGGSWSWWKRGTEGWRGYSTLQQVGSELFLAYNPIAGNPVEPNRIYRSFRWGRDLELFILDARAYRSRNDLADG